MVFFPVQSNWIADYDEKGIWEGGFNMGSALKPLDELSQKKGYRLIGCDLSKPMLFLLKMN